MTKDKQLPRDEFVAELIPDPTSPPPLAAVSGFVGDSPHEGMVRIYTNEHLCRWVELLEANILRWEKRSKDEHPLGGVTVWVRADENDTGAHEPPRATTLAVGEEDASAEPNVVELAKLETASSAAGGGGAAGGVAGYGPEGGMATTLAVGEEEPQPSPTTLAVGEEEGPTTEVAGEEQQPPGGATTLAIGEEEPSTRMAGEEDPQPTTKMLGEEEPIYTTLAVGEEDPPVTTMGRGEEGPPTTHVWGEEAGAHGQTTRARGEEMTTLAVGEEQGGGGGGGGGPFGGF